ncbi:MAG: dihydrodipicolinate synthase family protein, partial [Candidatus Latescibacteria bacterium]|nr:dihydrodipicolinate synthase family protein [Candidatus Latescibacterota bacterium]
MSILGAAPVLVTPFKDDGRVDEESLLRQLDFCIEAGSQALVFGWGSESHLLLDSELENMWRATVHHVDGRVPVVVATTHPSREGMIALTKLASKCGADCAMVNPGDQRGDQLVSLFKNLSDEVNIALMIQDAKENAPADVLLRAVKEAKNVTCLKLESAGAPHKMGLVCEGLPEVAGGRQVTVLGGSNGGLLLEELGRGSVGTLPHPVLIDAFQDACERYAENDMSGASDTYYQKILPLSRLTTAGGVPGGGIWLHKTIFQRAGILK